ncbi:MAG: dockerin [Candidatus Brocadiae bacterium]|nr:dockerin [Candidatus Brocadiia bacterium]
MKKNFCFTLLLFCLSISAQIIPSGQLVDWSNAGYPGDVPVPSQTVNVMDFMASGTGVVNDQPAIVKAIASLGGKPGIVYFPSGTYRLDAGVSIPSHVVLRGEGITSRLHLAHSSIGLYAVGKAANSFVPAISGYSKGSKSIAISDASFFSAGNYIEIRQANGSWDTKPASWATYSVGQIVKVESVEQNTLNLEDALRIDYSASLSPEVRKIIPVENIGIEMLYLERTDASTTGTGYNIAFQFAVKCWAKAIESNKSQGSHCMIGQSSQIEVTGCYFHHANKYDGGGTRGYGVTINNHAGQCLIENNIFRYLRHAMMTKHGANGNVFAYNYSLEPYRNGEWEFPQDFAGDISLHGHYSYANLFEGNIVQNIYIDQTWGPSGPYNTMFRNRAELYGLIMTSDQTTNQNFVGNEITKKGILYGKYILTGIDHFAYGNNVYGTIQPNPANELGDSSYYLENRPVFWNLAQWPCLGIPYTINTGTIPAKERYLSGKNFILYHR